MVDTNLYVRESGSTPTGQNNFQTGFQSLTRKESSNLSWNRITLFIYLFLCCCFFFWM